MRIFDLDRGMIFETRLGIKYKISGDYIYLVDKNDKYQFKTRSFPYFKYVHYQKDLSKCEGKDIDIIRVWDKDGRLIFGENGESNLYDEEAEQRYKERLSKEAKCCSTSCNNKNYNKRMRYYEEKTLEKAMENDMFVYLCTPLTL